MLDVSLGLEYSDGIYLGLPLYIVEQGFINYHKGVPFEEQMVEKGIYIGEKINENWVVRTGIALA